MPSGMLENTNSNSIMAATSTLRTALILMLILRESWSIVVSVLAKSSSGSVNFASAYPPLIGTAIVSGLRIMQSMLYELSAYK